MSDENRGGEKWESGGGHVVLVLPLVFLGANAVLISLMQRPGAMALWLAPVALFALGALVARRRRHRPLYLACVFLSAMAALFAVCAALIPSA